MLISSEVPCGTFQAVPTLKYHGDCCGVIRQRAATILLYVLTNNRSKQIFHFYKSLLPSIMHLVKQFITF
jgi:hypothetical protein